MRAVSPRYAGASEAFIRNGVRSGLPVSVIEGSSPWASVTPNGAIVHHGRPRAAAAALIRAIGWNAEDCHMVES